MIRPAVRRWNGITETEGNLGRTDLMLDTAVSWRFARRWSVTLSARVPLYSRAVGAQVGDEPLRI